MGLIDLLYITDENLRIVFKHLINLSTPSFEYVSNKIDDFRLLEIQRHKLSSRDEVEGYAEKEQLALDPVLRIDDKTMVTTYKYQDLVFFVVGSLIPKDTFKFEDEREKEEEESESDENHSDSDSDSESRGSKNESKTNEPNVSSFKSFNPLTTLEFIGQFIVVLESYVSQPITASKLKKKRGLIQLQLQNMVEAQYPFITDLNQIRELTPQDSIISKLIGQTRKIANNTTSVTRNSSQSSISSSYSYQKLSQSSDLDVFGSNNKIPWRRSNVKYTNNEMFVDFIETINVVFPPQVSSSSKSKSPLKYSSAFYNPTSTHKPVYPISATISGEIQFTSHLSGIPDIEMILDPGRHDLGIPSFHRSVHTDKWEKTPGVLSFIPADGFSKLMTYEIDLLNGSRYQDNLNEINRYLGLVDISFKTGLGLLKNEFEIRLNLQLLKTVKAIDDLKIDIHLHDQDSIKTLKLTHGDLLKSNSTKYQWIFDKSMSPGVAPILHGQIMNSDQPESYSNDASSVTQAKDFKRKLPLYIKLNYTNKGSLASGLKLNSLKIISAKGLGENVKPFKGVKYMTRSGDFVLR